ncbi:ABC transporter ATP-binding protein [Actinoplanes sp. NBRC 103695]|uniref:ATP-binding cassette domain-containing protein n=1 Tax=Actinoplanes sp. NBRC 103695 TaxID=3032202 RepID=UPI0024A586FD|nr:ABC transporter ATP-binding protein [Actinoplanes sp. NBRC 103695]GLY93072.1 ABC transporter ATP-binding protein [Actinoplanes sp. NBRC 103695]
MSALVEVEDLHVTFGDVQAVRGISFAVEPGECVAIVGESGSGKSVTARTLVGLAGPGAEVRAAALTLDGRDARGFAERDWRRVRGGFAGLVLQDALVSLDPLRSIGAEIGEVLREHQVDGEVVRLLADVHVPEPERRAKQYPHQLSGGLRQRALIASAIAASPPLLIADEPTTALDVTVQARILGLLGELKEAGRTLLLISHDLAVVAKLADRVLVMKDGQIVESGTAGMLRAGARHPYTKQLVAAAELHPRAATKRPSTGVVAEVRGFRKDYGRHTVARDVDLTVHRGEIVGLVGESGSGKTTVAHALFGLVEPTAGEITFEDGPWSGVPERRRRPRRRKLQLISQDPLSSFDPRWTVRRIVGEATGTPLPFLERVGLTADVLDRYPRQLSGGQRQRVAIARAIAPRPSLIVCDEPVSALDVSVQAQVLGLLAGIRAEDGTALLFISHDLAVIRHLADRVLVMKDGAVVEEGPVERVFAAPEHEYTRALLAAAPTLEVAAP